MDTVQQAAQNSALPNVAIGCTAIAVVVSIVVLSGTPDRAADMQATAVAARPGERNVPLSISAENLYDRAAPSVVTIFVKDGNGEPIGIGSGFFVDETLCSARYELHDLEKKYAESCTNDGTPTQHGYVLTNYHVIRPAVSIDVATLSGDEGFVSWVIAEDERADLALLSVNVQSSSPVRGVRLATLDPRVLSTVYAIGSPKGLAGSASEGKVSGYQEIDEGSHWLQTTAPISPGSSGGPLLLADGALAGVTTFHLRDGQNLNFAVPASGVRAFLATAGFRARDPAEGASLPWCEDRAFRGTTAAIEMELREYTAAEKSAVALLDKARREMEETGNDEQSNAKFNHAIALAKSAEPSLPYEFKYLAHYIAGRSHVGIWTREAIAKWEKSREPLEGFMARHGDSPHAQSAIHHFEYLTTLKPDFAPGWEQLANCYSNLERKTDALLAADTLVRLMPRCAIAHFTRAKCHRSLQQLDTARADQRTAIELSPLTAMLHYKLAEMLSDVGDYDKAIESFEKALGLGGSPELVQYALGLTHKRAGNLDKAIVAFTKLKALRFSPAWCDSEIAKCRQRQR